MDFLQEVGICFAEAAILVTAILIAFAGIVAMSQRRRDGDEGYIEVRQVNERYKSYQDTLASLVEPIEGTKLRKKAEKKAQKIARKAAKKAAKLVAKKDAKQTIDSLEDDTVSTARPRLFVLDFDGDMQASQVEALREEISVVIPAATENDEVLIRLESPGGLVHGYGLAASQLQRLRDANISLTVAVDKVAASGGYMMACVATRIIAAPFAVLGSIGVIAQLPNFHRLLKKNDIDFELYTAGQYKRTLTMFGENTDKGRAKFVEELEDTHTLFKSFVAENRSVVDIDQVSTGEVWYGQQALEVRLIDEISTSDSYIQQRLKDVDVLEIRYQFKKNWQERLGFSVENALYRAALKLWQQGTSRRLP